MRAGRFTVRRVGSAGEHDGRPELDVMRRDRSRPRHPERPEVRRQRRLDHRLQLLERRRHKVFVPAPVGALLLRAVGAARVVAHLVEEELVVGREDGVVVDGRGERRVGVAVHLALEVAQLLLQLGRVSMAE